ncbi:MAG TPA: helix-turn-helix transcriptional regulator [Thermoanaerobaculia bacterium]|nr:helix-turn-helix transcriptional regulator [Thermoanaerobaculia bacterium]
MRTKEAQPSKKREVDIPSLGLRIRKSREEQRWSQRKLGAEVDLRPERLSRLEQGDIAHPRLEEVARLARALGKRLEELVYGGGAEPGPAAGGREA